MGGSLEKKLQFLSGSPEQSSESWDLSLLETLEFNARPEDLNAFNQFLKPWRQRQPPPTSPALEKVTLVGGLPSGFDETIRAQWLAWHSFQNKGTNELAFVQYKDIGNEYDPFDDEDAWEL